MHLLLVDLDDTLIDTASFKTHLFTQLSHLLHTDEATLLDLYTSLKSHDGLIRWKTFIDLLADTYSAEPASIDAAVKEALKTIPIIQPVKDFVAQFQGYKIIFTLGDQTFQQNKIDILHVRSLVDEVLITAHNKADTLKQFISEKQFTYKNHRFDQVTLIDNDLSLLDRVKREHQWITVINSKELV